jgi:hypothetical protein
LKFKKGEKGRGEGVTTWEFEEWKREYLGWYANSSRKVN